MSSRVVSVLEWFRNEADMVLACSVGLLLEPLDAFLATFLHDDAEGGLLLKVSRAQSNPVALMLQDLTSLCNNELWGNILAKHFKMAPERRSAQGDILRKILLSLAGSLYHRCELAYATFPFKLVRLVAPDCTDGERRSVATDLFNTPRCDLDPWFSLRLRDWARTPEKLLQDPVLDLLQAWAAHAHLSTAHIERQHAVNKRVLERANRRRSAEAHVYCSFLHGLMAAHTLRGRPDLTLPSESSAAGCSSGVTEEGPRVGSQPPREYGNPIRFLAGPTGQSSPRRPKAPP